MRAGAHVRINVRLALDRLAKGGYVVARPTASTRSTIGSQGGDKRLWQNTINRACAACRRPTTERSGEHAPGNCRERGDLIRRERCDLYNQLISRRPRRGTLRCLQKESRRFMDAGGHPHRGGCPHSGRQQFQEHGREPHHREEVRQVIVSLDRSDDKKGSWAQPVKI
jgi:hypothetical protein